MNLWSCNRKRKNSVRKKIELEILLAWERILRDHQSQTGKVNGECGYVPFVLWSNCTQKNWLFNFQVSVCSNSWMSQNVYLGISSEFLRNSLVIPKYLIFLFHLGWYLKQTNSILSYNPKSIPTVVTHNGNKLTMWIDFGCLFKYSNLKWCFAYA